MKIGDRVKHKLSGEFMFIVSINRYLARCRLETPEIYVWRGQETERKTAVCVIENLEPTPITNQLSLV